MAFHAQVPNAAVMLRASAAGEGGWVCTWARGGGGGSNDPTEVAGERKSWSGDLGIDFDAFEVPKIGHVEHGRKVTDIRQMDCGISVRGT